MNGVNFADERRATVRLMVLGELAGLQDRIERRVASADVPEHLLKWVARVQATVAELILTGRGGPQSRPLDAPRGHAVHFTRPTQRRR